jgi:hypothetical protein
MGRDHRLSNNRQCYGGISVGPIGKFNARCFGSTAGRAAFPDSVARAGLVSPFTVNAMAVAKMKLRNRLGIIGIVLVALDELRRNQLDSEAHLLQLPGPMMGTTACFHVDLASRLPPLKNSFQLLIAVELFTPDRLLEPVNTMRLEDILCQINANADKLHAGLLLH